MCGSMAGIQSPTAEIRRGKKKEQTTGWKYKHIWSALLHRATINDDDDDANMDDGDDGDDDLV